MSWEILIPLGTKIIGPVTKIFSWVWKKLQPPDPEEILKKRLQMKQELEKYLRRKGKDGTRGDAIIRDIRRMDVYPSTDDKGRGISPWFKVELKDLYHRGLEVFISAPDYYVKDAKTDKAVRVKEEDPSAALGWPIGKIPFEWIERIDWQGDGYYADPHLYCRFASRRKTPYEDIEVCVEQQGGYFLSLGSLSY